MSENEELTVSTKVVQCRGYLVRMVRGTKGVMRETGRDAILAVEVETKIVGGFDASVATGFRKEYKSILIGLKGAMIVGEYDYVDFSGELL